MDDKKILDYIKQAAAALTSSIAAVISDAVFGSGWDGVTTIAPSKNAVYDAIEARKYRVERLRLWRGFTSADLHPCGIRMNAVGEDAMMHFYCNSHCDTSYDIIITGVFRVDNADTSISMTKSAGIIASDEAWNYTGYWNAVAWTLTTSGQNMPATADFTFDADDIEAGDLISLQIDLNEGSRDIYLIEAFATYVYKV